MTGQAWSKGDSASKPTEVIVEKLADLDGRAGGGAHFLLSWIIYIYIYIHIHLHIYLYIPNSPGQK